jgi:MtN3 and saliva related transmembrane protein
MFDLVTIVGTFAAVLSTVSFAPQAWRVIRTRDVAGLSSRMYVLTVSGFALWLTYGILRSDWALIAPNTLCLILSLFILTMIVASNRMRNEVSDKIESALPVDPA